MTRTLIAIETSTEYCSVALHHAGRVFARSEHAGQTHSERLLPMLADILSEAGIALKDCEAIAFGAGPGSFTGLRIACSVAQGLAYGVDRPVVAVDTLKAMAEQLRSECTQLPEPMAAGTRVLAALDARMQEVYWALYAWQGGEWQVQIAPTLSRPDRVKAELHYIQDLEAAPVHWGCGNGFDIFAAELVPCVASVAGPNLPDARAIAALAARCLARGEVTAATQAAPLYVRNHVALTTLERVEAHAQKKRMESATAQDMGVL